MKCKWNKNKQDAFKNIKRVVAHNTLLAYPDVNEEFNIYTDDINLQLGAVNSQNGKPIDFYSRDITDYQKIYTVTEKELLRSFETLKEF